MRVVDYSPGYLADHWSSKGHVLFVISGDLAIEHENGDRYELRPGMTWQVEDNSYSAHRVVCERGARVFIVD